MQGLSQPRQSGRLNITRPQSTGEFASRLRLLAGCLVVLTLGAEQRQLSAHGHGEADLVLAARARDDVRLEVGAAVRVGQRVGDVALDERPLFDQRAGQRFVHGLSPPVALASHVGSRASA